MRARDSASRRHDKQNLSVGCNGDGIGGTGNFQQPPPPTLSPLPHMTSYLRNDETVGNNSSPPLLSSDFDNARHGEQQPVVINNEIETQMTLVKCDIQNEKNIPTPPN